MTHGFDDQGRKFDAQGNLRDWWTPEDLKNFQERSKCVEDQYDSYVYEGQHTNGKLVLGEATADLGGLAIAYRAYQMSRQGKPPAAPIDGFTDEQRLFLAWARVWAANIRPERAKLLVNTQPAPAGRSSARSARLRRCPSSRRPSAASRETPWSARTSARSGELSAPARENCRGELPPGADSRHWVLGLHESDRRRLFRCSCFKAFPGSTLERDPSLPDRAREPALEEGTSVAPLLSGKTATEDIMQIKDRDFDYSSEPESPVEDSKLLRMTRGFRLGLGFAPDVDRRG